ncbi:hypothetical protein D0817_17915 [Flavobacterium cupreum]|uniref:Uncharacterized protein n=1 Tax=Flavobacterium cupreum TaxID=2133766 RepID=A0A434A3U5_9FLAO|nr:hypothetical protein D0817_17915 [Flavobacterium cupreum]
MKKWVSLFFRKVRNFQINPTVKTHRFYKGLTLHQNYCALDCFTRFEYMVTIAFISQIDSWYFYKSYI